MASTFDVDRYLSSLEATAVKTERLAKAHQCTILFGCGGLACFSGQYFTYSVLFWQAFSTSGWWRTKKLLCDAWQRLHAAARSVQRCLPDGLVTLQQARIKAEDAFEHVQIIQEAFVATQNGDSAAAQRLSTEMGVLQEEIGLAQQLFNTAREIIHEVEPQRLLHLGYSMWQVFIETLDGSLSRSADIVGLRSSLGDRVANAVNLFAEPIASRIVNLVVARSGEEMKQLREDPHAARWIQQSIRAACRSLGVGISIYVESLFLPIVNARIGAEVMSHQMFGALSRRGLFRKPPVILVLSTEWLLCAGGLYFQAFLGQKSSSGAASHYLFGTPKLPLFAQYVLTIPLVVETWLRAAVTARRLGLLDHAAPRCTVPAETTGAESEWIVVDTTNPDAPDKS